MEYVRVRPPKARLLPLLHDQPVGAEGWARHQREVKGGMAARAGLFLQTCCLRRSGGEEKERHGRAHLDRSLLALAARQPACERARCGVGGSLAPASGSNKRAHAKSPTSRVPNERFTQQVTA